MKNFLIILLFILLLQTWSKADDINEFEMEGMSIGQSLLEHMTKDEILKEINKENVKFYKYKRYVIVLVSDSIYRNLKIYDDVHILVNPNDKAYVIKAIESMLFFEKKKLCLKSQLDIKSDIEQFLSDKKFEIFDYDIKKKSLDPDELSVNYIDFVIEGNKEYNGEVRLSCTERKDGKNILRIILNGSEFQEFLIKNY